MSLFTFTMLGTRTCSSRALVTASAVALALIAAPAFGAMHTSATTPNGFGDLNDGFLGGSGLDDLPIVDEGNTPPNEIPPDIRAHSDVPDLPDSGGNPDENAAILNGTPNGLPSWYFDDHRPAVEPVFTVPGLEDGQAYGVVSSPVPAPGTLGALGVLAAATGIRRRRR